MKILNLLGFLLLNANAIAIADPLTAENSNYVVIGAFALQGNAEHFVEIAKKARFDAHFEMNANRQLFYVYVMHTVDKKLAIEEAQKLRAKTAFWDTWVFSGLLGKEKTSNKASDYHPETGEKIPLISADDDQLPATAAEQIVVTANENPTPVIEKPEQVITANPENNTPALTYPKTEEAEGNGRHFVFQIFRSSDKKRLDGDVDVIDPEKQKTISSFKGNKDVIIRPVNKSGLTSFECQVFGYRKVKYLVDINRLSEKEGIIVENDQAIVPFELVRLKKGDYAVMYNVFFFKDAAIMRPESSYEADALVEMMRENPNFKIRIHGHTNGNSAGKLIQGNDPKNFFSLSDTKESFGSAKKLSEERSILIQNYLISQGIDAGRLQVKAWGGKKPLLDKEHALAHTNVRVEIEVLEQ